MSRPPILLRRLRADARGASVLEFALLAPVMIIVFFGLVETGQAVLANLRTGHAASTVGDLVAQQAVVATSDTTDSFAAGAQMLAPMSTSTLKMKVTSVTLQSNGNTTVDWSDPYGGMTPDVKGATYTVPAGMLTNTGDSVIVATAAYTLNQASAFVLTNGKVFTRVSYSKPRDGTQVSHS